MKVLIVSHTFAPNVGGVETYLLALAEGLSASGPDVEVTVAARTPSDGYDDRALPFRMVRRPGPRALWRLLSAADIVHLAGPLLLPLALALLRRKPVVIEHHAYQAVCPNGLLLHQPTKSACPGHFMAGRYGECLRCNRAELGFAGSLRKLALAFPRRWLSRRADAHVAVSDHVATRIGLPRSRTIHHGVLEVPARAATAGEIPCFAYVGRLVAEKGLPLLLEAQHRLARAGVDARVKLVGDGPERDRLLALAASLELRERVTITGLLRGPALDAALDDVTALVMPSIWEETAGLAAIEQLMRGRAVVVADIGGVAEIVGDAGLKFRPGDAGALAEVLLLLCERPELARELGARGRERALGLFRRERMVADHLCLYREVAGYTSR